LCAVGQFTSTSNGMGRASLETVKNTKISVDDLAALGPEIVLVDVREPAEWAQGHLDHAVHVPLGTVPDRIDEFDGSPTYVICRSGGRSERACAFAADQGREVVNVIGGMIAWEQADLDMEPGANGG
jgi:rhodanese-related sulfurtransferase